MREGVLFGFVESDDLGVIEQVVLVPALADDLAGTIEDDAADGGIRRTDADAAPRQLERALHPACVFFYCAHRAMRSFNRGTKKCNRSDG